MSKPLELFWGSGSPFAWRVLLTLAIKQIEFESKQISFSDREHKTPEYLEMNPRGRVPTLRHGDFVLSESLAIMMYLEHAFPESVKLFGDSAHRRARVLEAIGDHTDYFWELGVDFSFRIFKDDFEDEDKFREKKEKLWTELSLIDQQIGSGFVVGDSVSAADVCFYPGFQFACRALEKPPAQRLGWSTDDLHAFENITAWRRRMEEIPGVSETYPPHWT